MHVCWVLSRTGTAQSRGKVGRILKMASWIQCLMKGRYPDGFYHRSPDGLNLITLAALKAEVLLREESLEKMKSEKCETREGLAALWLT